MLAFFVVDQDLAFVAKAAPHIQLLVIKMTAGSPAGYSGYNEWVRTPFTKDTPGYSHSRTKIKAPDRICRMWLFPVTCRRTPSPL